MSYRFRRPESVRNGISRMAMEQMQRAMREATDPKPDPLRVVHQVRRRCKGVRALLALGRGVLVPKVRRRADGAVRRAAKRLSSLRDAQALCEAFADLMPCLPEELQGAPSDSVARYLETRCTSTSDSGAVRERLVAFAAEMDELLERVPDWKFRGGRRSRADGGFDGLERGLLRTYGEAREFGRAARSDPSTESLHTWRRSVKAHAAHLALLRDTWAGPMGAWRAEADHLGRALGDDHDQGLLLDALQDECEAVLELDVRGALEAFLVERRARSRDAIWPLGARLFAEEPEALVDRLRGWWGAWRS